jgi:hypothetical protein
MFSRSLSSWSDPTPPALRSALVKASHFRPIANPTVRIVATKLLRLRGSSTAPRTNMIAKTNHTTRV